jgi:hypothetical protein
MLAIELVYPDAFDRCFIQASNIDAESGWVRPRPIEWLDPANPTKRVPGDVLVELVSDEELFATFNREPIARYQQVHKSRHPADRAIASNCRELPRRPDAEFDRTTMTMATVFDFRSVVLLK